MNKKEQLKEAEYQLKVLKTAKSLLQESVEILWDNCDCGECGPCGLAKQIEEFLGIKP